MTKSFIEEVRNYTNAAINPFGFGQDMAEKLIAIDELVTASKHGFASELAADIRKILEEVKQ